MNFWITWIQRNLNFKSLSLNFMPIQFEEILADKRWPGHLTELWLFTCAFGRYVNFVTDDKCAMSSLSCGVYTVLHYVAYSTHWTSCLTMYQFWRYFPSHRFFVFFLFPPRPHLGSLGTLSVPQKHRVTHQQLPSRRSYFEIPSVTHLNQRHFRFRFCAELFPHF